MKNSEIKNPDSNELDGQWFGQSKWHYDDVKCLRPDWSDERCEKFVERNGKYMRDRMIEQGWEILGILIGMDEDDEKEEKNN